MYELFLNLLLVQVLLGAFDTIYHHELSVALHQKVTARLELNIHAWRAMLYGIVFYAIAWYEWHGLWSIFLVTLIVIEIILTLWDFVIEDMTRLLPKSERITHTLLAINGGACFVLLAIHIPAWYQQTTAVHSVAYGWQSWFLSAAAIGVFVSGVRDAFAAWRVQRLQLNLDLDLGATQQRILISGATGFIGSALCQELLAKKHNITILSRNPLAAAVQFGGRIRAIRSVAELSTHEKFDTIINLAGAAVVGPLWTARRKKKLLDSRLNVTRELLQFVQTARSKPAVWIQSSAVGYYGTDSQITVDESAQPGTGFAAELCQQWEQLTQTLQLMQIRRVVLRLGLVFGRSGGALPMILLPFRFAMGAIIGNGQQHMAWIHIEDLLRLMAKAIADNSMTGVFNAVAPDCPTYTHFARTAARCLQRPLFLRIPEKLLRRCLGEMASLFADGPLVVPGQLDKIKFEYRFASLHNALLDLS